MKNIYLYAYWKKENPDDFHIGYGVNKKKFIMCLTSIFLVVLLSIIAIMFTGNKNIYYLIAVGNAIFTICILTIIHKNIGWYKIDSNGQIINKISNGFIYPPNIKNRLPISKKRFMEENDNE